MASLFDSDSDDSIEIVDIVDLDENNKEENLTAQHIQFSAVSVEYPPTDPEGYAIVYNFIESSDDEQIQIMKDQRTCGEVKICPYAHNDLHNYIHTSVDFDSNIFQSIKSNEELRTNSDQCNGELIMRKRQTQVLSTASSSTELNINSGYFIGCTQWKYSVSGHRYLPIKESIDRHLLKRLISGMPLNQCNINDTCNTVLPNDSKRSKCYQAIKLQESTYFQMDLTFKYVQGEINMFELNEYDEKHQLTLKYARIFTNISDANAYKCMFLIIIDTVKTLTNKLVKIQHIHNEGWKFILGDLDIAQAKGLGLALSEIDSTESQDEVQLLLGQIATSNEDGVKDKYGVAKTRRNSRPIAKTVQLIK
ncbi:15691_t:CDS:2 [Cetraspora pellucida]|uniref:15691_t:CDS:1 n=1 Tax=Cetraspora pellucida TaxID=1433469 RepID=A0ACA9K7I3_9GLOM|nr:15691_t:CDS:2 [Cetraspora pellucida]